MEKEKNDYSGRNESIVKMFLTEPSTFVTIAKKFGITRQRAYQIIISVVGEERMKARVVENRQERKAIVVSNYKTFICANCLKEFKSYLPKVKTCSKECLIGYRLKKKTDPVLVDERKRKRRVIISRWQEKNQDKVRAYNKRAREARMADPEKDRKYKERLRDYYIKKFGSVDNYKKALAEASKKSYLRVKSDPARYDEYKRKCGERRKKYLENIKLNHPDKWEKIRSNARFRAKIKYDIGKKERKDREMPQEETPRPTSVFIN